MNAKDELLQSQKNKELANVYCALLTKTKSLINTPIKNLILTERETLFEFAKPLESTSIKRLKGLGFRIEGNTAQSTLCLRGAYGQLTQKISSSFDACDVTNVTVDQVTGHVAATINGKANVSCGLLEDYDT